MKGDKRDREFRKEKSWYLHWLRTNHREKCCNNWRKLHGKPKRRWRQIAKVRKSLGYYNKLWTASLMVYEED